MCEYNLLDQQLYSIKWYKDNQEVFRFVPRNSEPRQIFPMDGVSVDKNSSDQHYLSLINLTHSSSGLYTCEVRRKNYWNKTLHSNFKGEHRRSKILDNRTRFYHVCYIPFSVFRRWLQWCFFWQFISPKLHTAVYFDLYNFDFLTLLSRLQLWYYSSFVNSSLSLEH